MTTIKIYGKIRSNSFSGNYTPCARRAIKASVYMMFFFTAPRLSSRLLHYAETKLHSDSISLLKYKRTRSRLKGNKLN